MGKEGFFKKITVALGITAGAAGIANEVPKAVVRQQEMNEQKAKDQNHTTLENGATVTAVMPEFSKEDQHKLHEVKENLGIAPEITQESIDAATRAEKKDRDLVPEGTPVPGETIGDQEFHDREIPIK